MAEKPIDRITLNFYGNIDDDKLLIDFLNSKYNKKFRGQKIKEILTTYLKNNGDLDEFKKNMNKKDESTTDVVEAKKGKKLKGLETY